MAFTESVEKFYRSLQDRYQAEPAGPDGILVEVDLVRARLERSSSKSLERELATPDWTERQPACGGLAEVLLAAGDRRRPRETQLIAVLGKAGHGKSCWARAVSRAWACGRLPQYDFVFFFPCRCLDRPGDAYRLQDLLFSLGPQPLPVDDEVFSHILRRPDRVLLILDAFEELEAQDGFLHSVCGPVSPEPRSLGGLLAGLFQRKLLRGCTLLLTARPRGRLAQSLSKADALFEMAGFSAEQAETYVRCYFELSGDSEHQERALELLRGQPFLLGHSHSPTVCRAVCQLSEALLERGDEAELPSTLTGLYVGLLSPAARDSPPGALVALARLAWELGRQHHGTVREGQFPSAEVTAWAVAKGLVQPIPGAPEPELAFSSFLLQCFLGAVWLALSGEIKDKELPQYLALTPRKKRPYDNWLEGVPRFLAGLVFQPRARCLGALAGPEGTTLADRKQKALTRYLKRLQPGMLRAGRLLELLHCAHEALDAGLWQHVVQGLPACLSFLGTRLTPPDTHVLGSALEAAGRDFSLDLRSTGIDPSGLGNLVGLSCVTRFRWGQGTGEGASLHGAPAVVSGLCPVLALWGLLECAQQPAGGRTDSFHSLDEEPKAQRGTAARPRSHFESPPCARPGPRLESGTYLKLNSFSSLHPLIKPPISHGWIKSHSLHLTSLLHSLLCHSTLYSTMRAIFPELAFDHTPPLLTTLQRHPSPLRMSSKSLNLVHSRPSATCLITSA